MSSRIALKQLLTQILNATNVERPIILQRCKIKTFMKFTFISNILYPGAQSSKKFTLLQTASFVIKLAT